MTPLIFNIRPFEPLLAKPLWLKNKKIFLDPHMMAAWQISRKKSDSTMVLSLAAKWLKAKVSDEYVLFGLQINISLDANH